MDAHELHLVDDAERIQRLVRILGASVNVEILQLLVRARLHGDGRDGEGWLFLSEIADALDQTPGTVGAAIQKLMPLLEEDRERGRRYFRSRVGELVIRYTEHPAEGLL